MIVRFIKNYEHKKSGLKFKLGQKRDVDNFLAKELIENKVAESTTKLFEKDKVKLKSLTKRKK